MVTNKRLLDTLARHQVYVEGLKADYYRNFNPVLYELAKEIRYLFSKTNKKEMSSFTKRELNNFIIELRRIQKQQYNVYTEKLLEQLREFTRVDTRNMKIILATLKEDKDEPVTEEEADKALEESPDDLGIFPVGWFKKDGDSEKLWSGLINAPIPANGMLLAAFIASFTTSASNTIENIIRKGYANLTTVDEVLEEIIGTESLNFRDGAFNRINNQHNAVAATVLQHITSYVQAGVQSIFFGKYRWVSVIDNATTDTCRSRNNKVFKYGAGPLPPAHINCRSKIVPVVAGDVEDVPSYYEWMKQQPKEFLDDVLGKSKADDLTSGKTKAKDMPQFSNAKAITLEQFASKLDKILKR